ncbi:hypothetical protein, partial [Providencia sp. wls1938]|uniref:hypothetical protein n=1 Tax=Providencia sp. wls1938 TaxID=2675151 RepID=UPI001E5E08E2
RPGHGNLTPSYLDELKSVLEKRNSSVDTTDASTPRNADISTPASPTQPNRPGHGNLTPSYLDELKSVLEKRNSSVDRNS